MDPLSIVAGAIALAQAAEVTGKFIKRLRTVMGTLPGRLDSINNEVADLEVVLSEVAHLVKERADVNSADGNIGKEPMAPQQKFPTTALADDRHKTTNDSTEHADANHIQVCVDRARGYLGELRGIVLRIEKAGQGSKIPARLARLNAFRSSLDRLNALEANIRTVKSTLNLFIGTAHTQQLRRVHVELLAVSTLGAQSHATNQLQTEFMMGQLLQQMGNVDQSVVDITSRIESIENLLRAQAEQQHLPYPVLQGPPPYSKMRRMSTNSDLVKINSNSSRSPYQQDSVGVRVGVRTSSCRSGCMCTCHVKSRAKTPDFIDRIMGQLFVDYAGFPGLARKCDDAECQAAQGPLMNAEYWFPAGVFWSRIIRFQVSFQRNMGPSFELSTLRRVPDTAEAVTFAQNGNIPGLINLFKRGVASPVDISETRGYSLLRWAMYSQQYKTCKFLLDAGADPDYRPKAPSDNSPRNKASDIILQGGLSQEIIECLQPMTSKSDWIDEQNLSKLHMIVTGLHGGSLEKELEAHPECVNEVDAMGRTALLWAAARGQDKDIVTLLRYGADPNIIDCQWSGPVAYSADRNHTVATRLLLEAGAITDVAIPGGYKIGSPLNCAARNATDPLLIKTLLDFGADVDACGVDGRTALIHAARTDNDDFALLLIEGGANINHTSMAGHTPLTTAVMSNSHRVLNLLLGRWMDYETCPRLKGPHLVDLTAQYADYETVMILNATDHFKVKFDKKYVTMEAYDHILSNRHDMTDELKGAFADFLSLLRGEEINSVEDKMETGRAFENYYDLASDDTESDSNEDWLDSVEYHNARSTEVEEVEKGLGTLQL